MNTFKQRFWDKLWYWWHTHICQPNDCNSRRPPLPYGRFKRFIYKLQLPICRWLDDKKEQ